MSPRVRRLRDATLHAAALAALSVPFAVVYGPSPADARLSKAHAAHCRTCVACPPGATEARDAYLIRTGSIEADAD